MTRTRLASALLVVLVVAAVAGVIVQFRLWDDGKTAGNGIAYVPMLTTAYDIANRAAAEQRSVTSAHVAATYTITSGGSTVKVAQDFQYDHNTFYATSETLGVKQEILQLPDGTCTRTGNGDWKTQPSSGPDSSVSGLGKVLGDITQESQYTNLQRAKDARTPDGRDVYVLSADQTASHLDDTTPDVPVQQGMQAKVDSLRVQVMVDQATLLIAEEKLDVSFHVGTSPGRETIDTILDRFNEPVQFPPDLPKTCAGGSA